MRFALVGFDGDAQQLIASLGERGRQLTIASDVGENAGVVRSLWPAVKFVEWESLLAGEQIDAAIVASQPAGELRDERLRKLVAAGVPLLVVFPACESLVAVELDMVRGDGTAPIAPWNPGRRHPAFAMLAEFLQQGEVSTIGRPTQAAFERFGLGDRRAADWLARDVALICEATGPIESVSAISPAPGSFDEQATVTMTTAGGMLARWTSHSTAADTPAARFTLNATRGRAVLDMPADGSKWRLVVEGKSTSTQDFTDWNGPRHAIEQFADDVKASRKGDDWVIACHHLEVVACAEESLRRGRTIDVQPTRHSEEGTFKGLMSLSGCGLLLTSVVALLVFAIIEGFRLPFVHSDEPLAADDDRRLGTHFLIRIWPVYPLLVFLLLQMLRLVFRKSRSGQNVPN